MTKKLLLIDQENKHNLDTCTGNIDHLNQMLAISAPTASNQGPHCQAGEPGSY